jgi:hypothetical protein
MGKQKGGSQPIRRRRRQRGGFGGLFNLPAMIGSIFSPKKAKAPPRRRPPPRRRRPPPTYYQPQPRYQPRYQPPPSNYRLSQTRAPPRRRPPSLQRAPLQKGGFIADSVNYGFDEQNVTPEKKPKKRTKQKGGSALPLNKIPWVKRVNLS